MPRKKKPKPRRARGEGTLFFDDRRGQWVGRVPIGQYPNGRTKYREVRHADQAEALRLKKLVEAPDAATVTVAEWAERWLAASPAGAPTKGDYRNTIHRYVIPTLGARRLSALTAHDVEAAAAAWAGALGPNTLRKNLRQLRTMLEAARRSRLVPENVAALAPLPKGKKVQIRPFTTAELARIVPAAAADPRTALFALLAAVGCRVGEGCALDVPDFDAAAGTVRITKTYDFDWGLRPPKSEAGVRTVRVPAPALPALLLARGDRTAGPLFPNGLGGRDHPNTAGRRWAKLLRRLAVPQRNLHQLRHTAATLSIAAGVHLANVARDLGDTVQTVVSTYLHPTPGAGVCDAMDAVLRGGGEVAAGQGV